jgi:chromosome segregation ATPase
MPRALADAFDRVCASLLITQLTRERDELKQHISSEEAREASLLAQLRALDDSSLAQQEALLHSRQREADLARLRAREATGKLKIERDAARKKLAEKAKEAEKDAANVEAARRELEELRVRAREYEVDIESIKEATRKLREAGSSAASSKRPAKSDVEKVIDVVGSKVKQ